MCSAERSVIRDLLRGSSKGCVPLGTYRVEKTRGLIDGMGIVGLPRTNGHNESIQDHVV